MTVVENDPRGVEVCVVTNNTLARNIVITVQTASKMDALHQATGNILCHMYTYSIDILHVEDLL